MNFPALFTSKKFIVLLVLILVVAGVSTSYYVFFNKSADDYSSPVLTQDNTQPTEQEPEYEGIDANSDKVALASKKGEKDALKADKSAHSPSDKTQNFNILVLGIDRRSGDQTHWRTDVIQLITLNPNRDKAVITHIPRDVWAGTYKINGVYNLQGPDAMKDIVEEVTGQRPDRIVRVDFDAFVWAVDGIGGLTINVPRAFTDSQYPNDRAGTEEIMTVDFEAGEQTMDGETALIYARSRKGDNGEGSDYARGTRQQLIMKSFIDDYFKPKNMFDPQNATTLYNIATQKVYSDMVLADVEVLFDVIKNYKNLTIRDLSLDTSNYLVVPDKSNYGGAWTLTAKNDDYTPIHEEINLKLQ